MDYYPISEEQIKSAKSFWEPRYGRVLSDDEAREIIRNTLNFFEALLGASDQENLHSYPSDAAHNTP
jgi:hypothetical protein